MSHRIQASLPAFLRPLVAAVLVAAVAGCGLFSPDKGREKPPEFKYPDLNTPQNAILNLKYAWERKDSTRVRDIMDDAYQGASTSTDGTLNFSKDQEVAAVGGIVRDQNVSTITFTLPDVNTWVRQNYSSDPANWTAISLRGYSIQVDDAVRGTLLADASSFFEFKLVGTVSAPGDTTWKIIRWTEQQ